MLNNSASIGVIASQLASSVAPPGAPTLTGPLEIDGVTGEAIYTADIPARHYWMLSANGTTPDAEAIAAGTGAIEGDSAAAFGHFDASDGSVQVDIDFPGGIDVTGAVFSVAARVEPDGTFSNILRDTDVDVNTVEALTATFVDFLDTASPNFGALDAGWYVAFVFQRNGTMTSITPPSQAAVTTPIINIVPTPASGIHPMRAYLVELTAPRSGAWAIGQTSGTSYSTALYALSAEPQVVDSASEFTNNAAKTYDFNLDVEAGDVLFGMLNGSTSTLPFSGPFGEVAEDNTHNITTAHTVRACSGVASSTGTLDVYTDQEGNFTYSSALALALRRAA